MKCCGYRQKSCPASTDCTPVGHIAGEDLLDLFLGESLDRVGRIHDHRDAVVSDDRRFHVHSLARSRADFAGLARRLAIPICAVPSMIAAIRWWTFGRNVKSGIGMLSLESFGQLRHEFGAKGIGSFDDQRSARDCEASKPRVVEMMRRVVFMLLWVIELCGRLEFEA